MRTLTLSQIAAWTGGALIQGTPSAKLSSVSTDSRKVDMGDLFFALKGDSFDGHRFIGALAEKEAGAIVVSSLPDETESFQGGIIRVKDTLKALQDLAFRHRQSSDDLRVIGVTGSNGKTSTKDFLSAVLSAGGQVNSTKGNFNNHIGLPLTILSGREGDRFGVWEMGMNHQGEIAALAAIAGPDAAIVTNVGTAHIEHLKTREGIAEEKSSLPAALPSGGYCVMPQEDDFYEFVSERTVATMIPVGIGKGTVQAESLSSDADGRITFNLASDFGSPASVRLPVRGRHMVLNALLAAAVGLHEGISPEKVASALSSVSLTSGRLQEKTISGISFLDDTYNANPDSMYAALQTLKGSDVKGRRVAVL